MTLVLTASIGKNARLLSKSKRYYSCICIGIKEKALRKFWISQSFLGINLVASWSVRHARGRPGAGAAWSKAGNNTSSTGAGTVISLIWSEVGWINGYTGVTGAVPGRHSVFGIIGLAFFLGWRACSTMEVFGRWSPEEVGNAATVASTWVLHISVGTVPFAKYSV